MAAKAERPKRGGVEFDQGSREGRNEKPSVPKCSEGLRKSSKKLEKLFSSFLRGASCPKSPRVAATAAILFMPESLPDVKSSVLGRDAACCVPTTDDRCASSLR